MLPRGVRGPVVSRRCGQCRQPRQRVIEVADHLVRDVHAGVDIGALDIDVQHRHLADPGLVFHLDRVVAQPDHQVGALDQRALQLAQGALDAAQRQRVVLVDQALGHHRRREGNAVALDQGAQCLWLLHAHGACADHRDRPLRGAQQFAGSRDGARRRRRQRDAPGRRAYCPGRRRQRLGGWRQRHVLGQVEMHRALRLGQGELQCLRQRGDNFARAQAQARLGDRLEQRVMVYPHLQPAAQLRLVQRAGDRDQGRAIEPCAAHAGAEIGGAGTQRGDAQAGHARHSCGDVRGERRGPLVRGEHEGDAAGAHRVHQRQHIAAGHAEAVPDTGGFEDRYDQIGVIHSSLSRRPAPRDLRKPRFKVSRISARTRPRVWWRAMSSCRADRPDCAGNQRWRRI